MADDGSLPTVLPGGGRLSQPPQPSVPAEILLGNMPSALFSLDSSLRFRSANPAAEQLFGASWNTLRGRPLAELLAPFAPLLDLARQVLATGSSISDFALELATARGEVMSVDGHLTPIQEIPGHVLVVLQPCSVARRLDQHSTDRGSGRSAAALAATLAHEVKNPLSGIRGAAQLLEPYVSEEDDKALVKLICDETDRICSLVDRMEELGDVRTGPRERINIHQVLEHVRRLAASGFARHHRILELYDPSLPEIEGDRDRLIQAFLNLVKNAAEAAPPDTGRIALATRYDHGLRVSIPNSRERQALPISVEVRDNGPGVQDDMIPHLFDPFVTTKPKGTGLGLPLVAKIIGDHGGTIACVRAGQGTIFRVRLPVAGRLRGGNGARPRR